MRHDVELAILGGGCAGLGLATALAGTPGWQGRVAVVEPRSGPINDRTWCFWHDPTLPLAGMVSRRWRFCRVQDGRREVVIDCSASPYEMVTAPDFHAASLRVLEGAAHVGLLSGRRALGVEALHDGGWRIQMDEGALTSRFVVDTRPPTDMASHQPTLWQCFLGAEVECPALLLPLETAVLMDFLPDQSDGSVWFKYVLPVTAGRALVEITAFGAVPPAPERLEALMSEAIAEVTQGATWRTLRREHGALPMGLAPRGTSTPAGMVRAGLFHGAARNSTGYAFQRIQRWARACATQLGEGGPPLAPATDAAWLRFMDSLFLRVLRAQPERAPGLFVNLFGRTPTPSLLRFLGRGDRLQDGIAVARSLPPAPFLRQLLA
ncbi:MAG: hypothetical protein RL026_1296 [Pseudomonadota bacterium]|jgi:lycopene beta-cyclase